MNFETLKNLFIKYIITKYNNYIYQNTNKYYYSQNTNKYYYSQDKENYTSMTS